jgi:hypothetical protein
MRATGEQVMWLFALLEVVSEGAPTPRHAASTNLDAIATLLRSRRGVFGHGFARMRNGGCRLLRRDGVA